MTYISINTENTRQYTPLLSEGFRPFFLLAALHAAFVMVLWMATYTFGIRLVSPIVTLIQWHAHEMVFGFSMAVVAGFLLTAVPKWTGQETMHGMPLAVLTILWTTARVMSAVDFSGAILFQCVADLGFMILLCVPIFGAVIRARQWTQIGVLTYLTLLVIANCSYYSDALGWPAQGIRFGNYLGLYLVIGLILLMCRRLIPMFAARTPGIERHTMSFAFVDRFVDVLFLGFVISEMLFDNKQIAGLFSSALFLLHSLQLYRWYVPGVLQSPLLWSLYAGYGFLTVGFAMYTASAFLGVYSILGVHAFAIGGIGIITFGMMARVALGHTGRNILNPPRTVGIAVALLIIATVARVFIPIFSFELYLISIGISQALWILAFLSYLIVYFPMLCYKNAHS